VFLKLVGGKFESAITVEAIERRVLFDNSGFLKTM
jgi:hypothetical protein